MKLKDHIAIVTGGGGAIGGAIARKLSEEGATVILFDLRPVENRAEESVAIDITDATAVRAKVDEIFARFGRIDILVNCAGGSARERMKYFHEQSLEVVRDVIGVNLFGALNCIHAVAPRMVAGKCGRIINIGSAIARQGLGKCVDYSASKGAIIAATKSLAKELGGYNINVNCVSPGQVPREVLADPGAFARRHSFLNRVCHPDDIASLVLYLTLPEAGFITGQNYIVDGGRSLGMQGSDVRE